jgi:hypothetical protein
MMINSKALPIGDAASIRHLAIAALLIVAVAVSPKQAHADGVETSVAIIIGAAVLYAAHDSYRHDRRHSKKHLHDRHCGHQVSYPDTGHHNSDRNRYNYNNGYRNQHTYTDIYIGKRGDNYYRGESHYSANDYRHDKQGKRDSYENYGQRPDRLARDDRNHKQQDSEGQQGRGSLNDRQQHNEKYWNTRLKVSQRH